MARPTSGHLAPDPPPGSIDDLIKELRPVVRRGLAKATARPELGELQCVQERAVAYPEDDDGLTHAWRDVIRAALDALDPDDDRTHAVRLLLGAAPETSKLSSAAERRARAAAVLNIADSTLRKNHEPKLLREVAEQIYRLEHPPADAGSLIVDTTGGIAALDDILALEESQTEIEPSDENEPADRRIAKGNRVRARRPLGGRGIPPIFVRTSPQLRQTYSDLRSDIRDIRDQYQRRLWIAVFALGGTLVALRFGLDALPRYTAAVSVIMLGKYLTETVMQWRTAGASSFDERLPQITAAIMLAALSASFIAVSNDDNSSYNGGRPIEQCVDPDGCDNADRAADAQHVSPNYTPTTYATIPAQPSEPECPPPGNREKRIQFSDVPPNNPLCIDPRKQYTATVQTNYGYFTIDLNTSEAPYTVNNFVYLARWHYYDGLTLNPYPEPPEYGPPSDYWHYLISGHPVDEANSHTTDIPGYSLVFDTPDRYPDDTRIYAVMTASQQPDQFAIVVSPTAHQQIETDGNYPVLGEIINCHETIAFQYPAPENDGWHIIERSAPIVIDAITITENDPSTTTTTHTPIPNVDPCDQLSATGSPLATTPTID